MKWILVSCYFCSLLLAAGAPAKKAPPQLPPGERFLFVVDTSSSMKSLDAANRQALFDLVYFGLDDQMLPGDTYGIWTFDEEAHIGEFPMQVWNPTNNLELASQAATFLKGRRYHGETRILPIMVKIAALVRGVRDVNVFIISDGDAALEGPPVAEKVNAAYKARGTERRRAKKPFITTMVVRNTVVISGAVTIAGEPIRLPERPVSVAEVVANQSLTAQTNKAALTSNQVSLRSRTQTAPASPTNIAPEPVLAPTLQAKPAVAPIIMQGKTRASHTNGTRSVAEASKQSPIVQTNAAAAELLVGSELKPINGGSTNARFSESAAIKVSQDSATLVPTTEGHNAETPAQLSRKADDATDSKSALPSAAAPSPRSSGLPALSPTPMVVSAREQSSTNVTEPGPALAVAIAAPQPILRPATMMLIGTVLFAGAFGLTLFTLKRRRSIPQPSFISRSMDGR